MGNVVPLKVPCEILECTRCGSETFHIQPNFVAVCTGCAYEIVLVSSSCDILE
jgi:hypothetical protein